MDSGGYDPSAESGRHELENMKRMCRDCRETVLKMDHFVHLEPTHLCELVEPHLELTWQRRCWYQCNITSNSVGTGTRGTHTAPTVHHH
jgi:hypothetical protein